MAFIKIRKLNSITLKYFKMHNKDELKILNKAMDLAESIYLITSKFPSNEIYDLTSQMRRCAVSIPSNIAEGAGRNSNNEFIRFLAFANGSSYELDIQLKLCERLVFISDEDLKDIFNNINEIQKMNYKLQEFLLKKTNETRKV